MITQYRVSMFKESWAGTPYSTRYFDTWYEASEYLRTRRFDVDADVVCDGTNYVALSCKADGRQTKAMIFKEEIQ